MGTYEVFSMLPFMPPSAFSPPNLSPKTDDYDETF